MRRWTEGDLSSSRILLVEGPDDRHVFEHLLIGHGISGQFELEVPSPFGHLDESR